MRDRSAAGAPSTEPASVLRARLRRVMRLRAVAHRRGDHWRYSQLNLAAGDLTRVIEAEAGT